MSFTIQHGDALFSIVAPDGTEAPAMHYCNWCTLEYQNRVYGAYLSGEVDDDDDDTPLDGDGKPPKVYDITDHPTIVPMETVLVGVAFEGEVNSKGVSLDGKREVECPKCDGDGYYFEDVPGWVEPLPEDDDVINVEPV